MKKLLLIKTLIFLLIISIIVLLSSCKENYSTGEFSQRGLVYPSWEGSLNTIQTGTNSVKPFNFSVDTRQGSGKQSGRHDIRGHRQDKITPAIGKHGQHGKMI